MINCSSFLKDIQSYLFAKYLNANIPPRAKSANPKVSLSIPDSSPTSPSCLRCLKLRF